MPPWVKIMPSPPSEGISTSAVIVNELFFRSGAEPSGKATRGVLYTNVLRPAARLGLPVICSDNRSIERQSSGRTSWRAASAHQRSTNAFSFSGFFAARSSACEKSWSMRYSSPFALSGSYPVRVAAHGRYANDDAIHPLWYMPRLETNSKIWDFRRSGALGSLKV